MGGALEEQAGVDLLRPLATELDAHGIEWGLEAGTLLGAVRDRNMVPHELDNDIFVSEEDGPRVIALKQLFMDKYGLTMAVRDIEPVFMEGVYTLWKGKWDPYVTVGCARLYDKYYWLSTDIFCLHKFPESEMDEIIAKYGGVRPITRDSHYLTTGFSDKCAIRAYSDVYPLQRDYIIGMNVSLPLNTDTILRGCYGEDWHIPKYKGIKIFFCGHHLGASMIFVVVLSIVFYLYGPVEEFKAVMRRFL